MSTVFLRCINLSISAGWLILAVLALRPALRKAPRWICCLLWMLVGLRLLCPFTLHSPLSLIPSARTIPDDILQSPAPAISSGIPVLDAQLNPLISASFTPTPEASVNPLQIITSVAACIWLMGVIAMLLYLGASFIRLRLKMRTATLLEGNVRRSEFADSPFILGIFRPQIYINYGLSGDELAYVLAHEQAHLARRDHLLKPLAFLILSIYWFHPLVWLSYVLFCKDIELACDERVIRGLDDDLRKSYSLTLLSCAESRTRRRSGHRSAIGTCPLAFGELNIKERVLRIKNYRRPAPFFVAAAIAVCAVTALCFLTSPDVPEEKTHIDGTEAQDSPASTTEAVFPDGQYSFPPPAFTLSQEEIDAITDAILSHNHSASAINRNHSAAQDAFSCCSFVLLSKAESTSFRQNKTHDVIYYGWALYQEYAVSSQGIREIAGSHVPVELTFELSNDHHQWLPSQSVPLGLYLEDPGYVLKEYWTPGEGSRFREDIQERFPTSVREDALDSQKYILPQKIGCYRQAVLASGLDREETDLILSGLLDSICREPSASSDIQSYIDAHPIEYRELTYYGNYTLDYSQRHPEQDLRGQILFRACEEIYSALSPFASTAQPD